MKISLKRVHCNAEVDFDFFVCAKLTRKRIMGPHAHRHSVRVSDPKARTLSRQKYCLLQLINVNINKRKSNKISCKHNKI